MKKSTAFTLLKALLTLLILGFVLRNVDLTKMLETLAHCRFHFIFVAVLVFATYQFVYVYNWGRVLVALKERVGYRELLTFHMIGLFYNLFLPTSMGGDLAKIYYLSKRLANRLVTIKSIAILRGIGLLTNLILVGVSIAVTSETIRVYLAKEFSSSSIPTAGLGAVSLACGLAAITRNGDAPKLVFKAGEFIGSMRDVVRNYKGRVISIIALSLVAQFLIIIENSLLLAALGIEIPFVDMMYIIPLTFFATLLPITIAGLGIREGAFIYFLQKYHYTVDDAVAFSLLGYILMLLMGIAGGIINVAAHSAKE